MIAKQIKSIKVLGIDPGLANTGFGIINVNPQKSTMIDYGFISTKVKEDYSDRLDYIYQTVRILIKKFKPQYVAVEDLFFNKNIKSAMVVGQAKGVILLAAKHENVPVYEYSPLQIKMAVVGYGRASKDQVQNMVKNILSLSVLPKPDHAADALAAALCCSQSLFNLNNK